MKNVALFSPNGYLGSNIKKRFSQNAVFNICEITRGFNWNTDMGEIDTFIYSAAVTREREEAPEKYIQDNAQTAVQVVGFCQRNRVKRIIYISSDEIYGKLNIDQIDVKAVMVEPNIYAITKYLAERVIIDSKIPYFILRLPGIVGKKWGKSFIYRLIDTISCGEEVILYNADKMFNNVVDIDDLTQFIELLTCHNYLQYSEVFLLGNIEKIQLSKLVEYIKRLYGSNSNIIKKENSNERYFTLNVQKALSYGYHSKKILEIVDELYRYNKMKETEHKETDI